MWEGGTNAPPVPTALLSWQAHDSLECVAKTVDHFSNVFFHFKKFVYKAFFLDPGGVGKGRVEFSLISLLTYLSGDVGKKLSNLSLSKTGNSRV